MPHARITGVGYYAPENIVTNADLEAVMGTSDQWIRERTGIEQRHWFTRGTDTNANMAAKAAKMALERAAVLPTEIDMIVYATITPDYFFPGSAFLMQRELGMEGITVFDIRQQCSGFIYALSVADNFIKTGMKRNVLVVGSELQSTLMDKDPASRAFGVIFADGAGAVVVQATEDSDHRILSTHLFADGTHAEELYVRDPGSSRYDRFINEDLLKNGDFRLTFNGKAVFKHAVVRFSEAIQAALDANGYAPADLSLLVPHQANIRISEYVRDQLGLRDDQVFNNIQHYGNTTAASIPIAMGEAWEQGLIKDGDLLCLAAFGSGFTWASALIRW